jgi:serine protease Do
LVRLEQSIAGVAREFVRVRVLNMRGVDLQVFDFDYDLDWAAMILTPDEKVIGRFGGNDGSETNRYRTFPGLRYALEEALRAPRPAAGAIKPGKVPSDTVENYKAMEHVKADACIHCHQVYDFRRQALRDAGKWQKEMVWVYPLPANVGLRLDPRQGNRIELVDADSAAQRLGLEAGDILRSVNGQRTASFADVQYALHRAGASESIPVAWEHDGGKREGNLRPPAGWRVTDLSWRASTKRLGPAPSIHGDDLSLEQKQRLGIEPKRLAMVLGPFLPAVARQAGLRQGDIIVGVDDKRLEMTTGQFDVYLRLNYQPGQKLTYNLLRGGRPESVTLTLPASAP